LPCANRTLAYDTKSETRDGSTGNAARCMLANDERKDLKQ
jgi:hypothetical protein